MFNMVRFGEGLIGFFLHVQCYIEIVHDIFIDFNINLQAVAMEDGRYLLLDEVCLTAGEPAVPGAVTTALPPN